MERLADYLPSHRRGMLGRIFLAQKLEQALSGIAPGKVRVAVRSKTIQLVCQESALARKLELERRKIEQLLVELTGSRNHGLTVKIRVGAA